MAVFVADEQTDVPIDAERMVQLVAHVLRDRRVPDDMEVSIMCVDRPAIAALNRTHMGEDRPTDVLAFPLDAPGESLPGTPAILGDVVLCPAVAAEQASDHGNTAGAEIDLLVVHGILHLLGHDHAEEEERQAMFALTDDLLASFAAGGAGPRR